MLCHVRLAESKQFAINCSVSQAVKSPTIMFLFFCLSEVVEILIFECSFYRFRWKADAVLVWLELVLHMEQYVKEFEENIKSGKVNLDRSFAQSI